MINSIEIIIKGMLLGLAVSMPPGPVGIILVNRTIKRGVKSGFSSGLGLALADTILAIVAGIGFSFIISFIQQERLMLGLAAGIVVAAVGVKVYLSNPVREFRKGNLANKSLWRDFYSVFIMSVTNPYTILIFVAFFSGIKISNNISPEKVPFLLVPGVFVGAMAWWISLSYLVSRVKSKLRLRNIVLINKISGLIITAIGIVILISLLPSLRA